LQEEFEDTKGVIKSRQSKKERRHNGQTKNDKRTNNDLQKTHLRKLRIEQPTTSLKDGSVPEGQEVRSSPLATPVVLL